MNLKLHKPLCIFDLETTGINISKEKVEVNIFGDVIIRGLNIKDHKNKKAPSGKGTKRLIVVPPN